MSKRFAAYAFILALAIGTVVATTEIVLQDGRVIGGAEVRREGDNFVVVLESGETIVLPAVLVKTVRLKGSKPSGERDPVTGLTAIEGSQIAGQAPPEGPSGLTASKPQQLAGAPVPPPRTQDQLGALGSPSRFQQNIVDNNWAPATDWDMDPARQNNFAPSTWAEDIVDNRWEPASAWDPDENVLADSRSSFQKGIIDNSWAPTDGFATP